MKKQSNLDTIDRLTMKIEHVRVLTLLIGHTMENGLSNLNSTDLHAVESAIWMLRDILEEDNNNESANTH